CAPPIQRRGRPLPGDRCRDRTPSPRRVWTGLDGVVARTTAVRSWLYNPTFRAVEPNRWTGDPGIEPGVAVLETAVLPIHQSPGQPVIVGVRRRRDHRGKLPPAPLKASPGNAETGCSPTPSCDDTHFLCPASSAEP